MSQENVGRFHQALDAFNRRDLAAFLALAEPDVEFTPHVVVLEGAYRDHDGVRRWWQDLFDIFPDWNVEGEVRDLGDQTLAALHVRGHGGGSGTPVDQVLWQVAQWSGDGKMERIRNYADEAEALEAVGLRESAMSRENVELMARGLEALNARNADGLVELMHEECEWRPALTAGGSLEGAVYRGPEGMARYLLDLDAEFSNTRMEVESIEAIDANRVFYRGRVIAQGRASGINLDVPIWAVWEVRDGKMARGTAYLDEAEALEAVGLRE